MKRYKTFTEFISKENQQDLRERLVIIMRKDKKLMTDMSDIVNISRQTLSRFLHGDTISSPVLSKIEEYVIEREEEHKDVAK